MIRLLAWASIGTLLCLASPGQAEEQVPRGSLLIIGGGLRPDNTAIVLKLIAGAGGHDRARFVIFPSAAKSDRPAREFREVLAGHGIPHEHATIVDLTPENAKRQAANPEVVAQIRQATAAFFVGGDQARIVQSLRQADQSPTPALVALDQMWRGGGVIAGSSAGAAVQSARMLRVAGLPDESLDLGMDALDFGISSNRHRRGVQVTAGLGFFEAGIVDQHFSQFRGRLGRLSRALIHERVRFGFGIDENTALAVSPDGQVEVVGNGNLTIIDARDARCADDALGCRLSGLKLTFLQAGDGFDPATGTATVRTEKKLIAEGTQDYNGNHLITDIDAPAALPWAICLGLAENTSRRQEGVSLQYHHSFGHGYRYTFTETERTRLYAGYADHFYSYAVTDVQFEVDPVLGNLQAPQTDLPIDLPMTAARPPLEALWFRGILLANERCRLRPADPITRIELAGAIARTIHLTHPREGMPKLRDVSDSTAGFEDAARVVAARLMTLDETGRFRPQDVVTRAEAAASLMGLSKLLGIDPAQAPTTKLNDESDIAPDHREAVYAAVSEGLLFSDGGNFRPAATFTRQEAALAICQLIDFDWTDQ